MADYATLAAAVAAGTANMTVRRNNSKSDDGTDTLPGVSWFIYNNVAASNLYTSGNSWTGFGSSSEQLKVNRRDCAVWYEYTESGIIGAYTFFKLRWQGYSHYSATDAASLQGYDVFLLSTGQIYLNYYAVPSSNNSGTNALVCGSQTVSFSTSAGVPCEWTFTPTDAAAGTGWSAVQGKPILIVDYKPTGSAVYAISLDAVAICISSLLTWEQETPEGTSVAVAAAVTDGAAPATWAACSNGSSIPGLSSGTECTGKTLWLRVTLATEDIHTTPVVSALAATIRESDDLKRLRLRLSEGNVNSIQNAAGDVSVTYVGGTLMGLGGPVADFSEAFTPTGLTFKGNQNDEEHIEVAAAATGSLLRVYYTNAACGPEHIEVTAQAVGNLIHVDDI